MISSRTIASTHLPTTCSALNSINAHRCEVAKARASPQPSSVSALGGRKTASPSLQHLTAARRQNRFMNGVQTESHTAFNPKRSRRTGANWASAHPCGCVESSAGLRLRYNGFLSCIWVSLTSSVCETSNPALARNELQDSQSTQLRITQTDHSI